MTKFERTLNPKILESTDLASTPWMMDLLRHWYPAGHAAPMVDWVTSGKTRKLSGPRPMGLRLAIRNGYANFYCGGQSIARVTMGKALSAETHQKYLADDAPNTQSYTKLGADHADVASWMARSHAYHGIEKLFVEDVCVRNGTVIDIEMGLPSLNVINPETGIAQKVALRIDLVALERVEDGWQVVFWEAKLPDDSRMRSTGDTPHIMTQMKTYAEWFAQPEVSADVLAAYKGTCKIIADLRQTAVSMGIDVPPLHQAIIDIAETPSLLTGIDPQVRLLIDMRKGDQRFDEIHLPKIADIPMHCVRTNNDLVLPVGQS